MRRLSKTDTRTTGGIHRGHMHDLTRALGQQMFFWGRDVLTNGNLLLDFGFQKLPSPGLQGTSCYRFPWKNGVIELHGACAGWYPAAPDCEPGFLFIRSRATCFTHRLQAPVVPGDYPQSSLKSSPLTDLIEASRTFTAWLCDYEDWIRSEAGPMHRQACHQMFQKLPASRPWLPPALAHQWLRQFANASPGLVRARRRPV